MTDKLSYLDAVHNRRSIYQLKQSSPISDDRIEEIIHQALEDVPSSFNSQSTRLVVLLKEDHRKFWNIVIDCLKAIVPADSWPKTEKRIAGFRDAYGSVLFYEDSNVINDLQAKYAIYADRFPQWSEHTSGMHQYAIWTALEAEGFGANIQHYNPLPDQRAAEVWNIPREWQLKAQLVFGEYESDVREKLPTKTQQPIDKRLYIHGK
ncbi:putative nitroreductase [Neonectria punicea]|uniref:Nitroreductase n=1 Tax=Neonectria punicea TaxID=979145 RepID=A0ABR1HAC6_9HYPO